MVEKGTFSKEDAAPPSQESHEVSTGYLKLERTEGKKCFELNLGLLYLLFCFKISKVNVFLCVLARCCTTGFSGGCRDSILKHAVSFICV